MRKVCATCDKWFSTNKNEIVCDACFNEPVGMQQKYKHLRVLLLAEGILKRLLEKHLFEERENKVDFLRNELYNVKCALREIDADILNLAKEKDNE